MGKHSQLTSSLSISFTKLISENKVDWDEHLHTMFFSYIIAYKVATRYTPYQLVYGLHLFMPT
jgi:hypothetical protein